MTKTLGNRKEMEREGLKKQQKGHTSFRDLGYYFLYGRELRKEFQAR